MRTELVLNDSARAGLSVGKALIDSYFLWERRKGRLIKEVSA